LTKYSVVIEAVASVKTKAGARHGKILSATAALPAKALSISGSERERSNLQYAASESEQNRPT
jgi:hypothetical protein